MIDVQTRGKLEVFNDGDAGPYIMVSVDQLEKVESLLRSQHVSFWTDEEAISINDQPEIAVINLGLGTDPKIVQAILDSKP